MAHDPIWPPRPEQLRPPADGSTPAGGNPFWGHAAANPYDAETTIAPATQPTQPLPPGPEPSATASYPQTAASATPAPTAAPIAAAPPAAATASAGGPPRRRGPGIALWIGVLAAVALIALAIVLVQTLRPKPATVVTVYQADTPSAVTSTRAASPTSAATTAAGGPATTSAPGATKTATQSATSQSSTASASYSPSPSPSSTQLSEADALQRLAAYHDADASAVTPSGQWVAALASKWVGVVDPLQTTQSGSHTFQAVDILNEHEALRRDAQGADIRLLYASDYGTQQTHDGATIYVTVANDVGSSRADVEAWCQQRYPDKTGSDLDNLCMPLQLKPKS